MPRLFFALYPDEARRSAIAAAAGPLVQSMRCGPVPDANLHLTLCFLGEVADASLPHLLDCASQVVAGPVQVMLTQVDYWPGSRVLGLVADTAADMPWLAALAKQLDTAARHAGIAPDPRPFHAHVTVARRVAASAAGQHWPRRLPSPISLDCDGFVLMRSKSTETGSRYQILRHWPDPDRTVREAC